MHSQLESEFGESVHMFSDDNGKLIVIPDNLSIEALMKDNMCQMGIVESVLRKDNAELRIRSNKRYQENGENNMSTSS